MFKKVLLLGSKYQTKLFKLFENFYLETAAEVHPSSIDKGLRDIGYKISMILDTRKYNP